MKANHITNIEHAECGTAVNYHGQFYSAGQSVLVLVGLGDAYHPHNEFPINDLNDTTLGWTVDPEMIRRVQISVLTRSTQGDALDGEVLNRYRRPQIANRLAGARDDLPRRRFTVSVLPRNIL